MRPERVRVRVRVQTLPLTRTLDPSRNPNLLEPVELAVDDDGKVAAEARQGARLVRVRVRLRVRLRLRLRLRVRVRVRVSWAVAGRCCRSARRRRRR